MTNQDKIDVKDCDHREILELLNNAKMEMTMELITECPRCGGKLDGR